VPDLVKEKGVWKAGGNNQEAVTEAVRVLKCLLRTGASRQTASSTGQAAFC